MPTYRTREQKTKKKGPRRYPKRLPRDPDKLFRWAAKGSPVDYERLRALAKKARHSLPAHIDGVAFEKLMHVDRLTMIEQIQAAEEHDISAGWFLDAVNWLFDKIPLGNWIWPVSAAQSAINTQKRTQRSRRAVRPAGRGDLRRDRRAALRDRSLEAAGAVRQQLHQRV